MGQNQTTKERAAELREIAGRSEPVLARELARLADLIDPTSTIPTSAKSPPSPPPPSQPILTSKVTGGLWALGRRS